MPEGTALNPGRLTARQMDHAERSFTRLTDDLAVNTADLLKMLGMGGLPLARAVTRIETPDARRGRVRVTERGGRYTFEQAEDVLGMPEPVTLSRAIVLDQVQLRLGAEAWPDEAALKTLKVSARDNHGNSLIEERIRGLLQDELPENRELARVLDGGAPAVLCLPFQNGPRWLLVFRLGKTLHVRVSDGDDFTQLAPQARALRDLGLWPEGRQSDDL